MGEWLPTAARAQQGTNDVIAESLVLAYDMASAGIARAGLRNALRRHGASELRGHDAALVVSELVGNSLRHASPLADGTILVRWRYDGTSLTIEVTDGGGGEPVLRQAGIDAVSGRGLAVIDAVARRWGYRQEAEGTTVWAELRMAATSSAREVAASATRGHMQRPPQRHRDLSDGGDHLVR